ALGLRNAARPRLGAILWAGIAAAQIAALIALPWIAEAPYLPLIVLAAAALAAVAGLSAAASWRGYPHLALCGGLFSGLLFYGAAFRLVLPNLKPIWISTSAASAIQALKGCPADAPGFAGFSEPSLVFLNGTKTLLAGPAALGEAL